MRRFQLAGLLCLLVWCARVGVPASRATISAPARPNTVIAHARAAVSPSCLNDPTIGSKVWTVAISGTLAFLADGQALTILDISDRALPVCRSHLALPPASSIAAIEVRDNYAYLALNNSSEHDTGLQIVGIQNPDNPVLLGSYQAASANNLAIVENLVYLPTVNGLYILDVTDPTAPSLQNTYMAGVVFSSLLVVGDRMYVHIGGAGFDILSLADPIHPVRLGGFYEGEIPYYGFDVVGDRAYVIRPNRGVEVLDVSNPNNPLLIGTYTNIVDGNAQTLSIRVVGNTLYIAGTKFEIYDVSSSTTAVLLGSYDPPGFGYNMRVVGNSAYLANADRGSQSGDYGFEIIDLSNQASPFLRGWFHNGSAGRFFYMPPIRR
ncbi:MAG: hypothetical protein ABIV47_10470 [Roseiflexaceae bacterium]